MGGRIAEPPRRRSPHPTGLATVTSDRARARSWPADTAEAEDNRLRGPGSRGRLAPDGAGAPVPQHIQRAVEAERGVSLDRVRVHTGTGPAVGAVPGNVGAAPAPPRCTARVPRRRC